MDAKMIATSKWMSFILRHCTHESPAIHFEPGGWVSLLDLERAGRYSAMEILNVLEEDQAGRYEAFCSQGTFWVRATSKGEPPLFNRLHRTETQVPPPPAAVSAAPPALSSMVSALPRAAARRGHY